MLERENLLSSRPTICLESKAGMLLDLSLEQSLLLIYDDDNDETMYICEIPVCIIDTPGLGAMDLSSKEEDLVLASVSVLTDKDLLYYCMSLVGRFDNNGEHIAKQLTSILVWKYAIFLALTCNFTGTSPVVRATFFFFFVNLESTISIAMLASHQL